MLTAYSAYSKNNNVIADTRFLLEVVTHHLSNAAQTVVEPGEELCQRRTHEDQKQVNVAPEERGYHVDAEDPARVQVAEPRVVVDVRVIVGEVKLEPVEISGEAAIGSRHALHACQQMLH